MVNIFFRWWFFHCIFQFLSRVIIIKKKNVFFFLLEFYECLFISYLCSLFLSLSPSLSFSLSFPNFPVAFLASWLPYAIVSLLFVLGDPGNIITPAAEISCAILAKCSVIWNPLIYVMTNAQLRNNMLDVFRDICYYLGCNRKEFAMNGREDNLDKMKSSRRRRLFRREDASFNTEISVATHSKIVHMDTVNIGLIRKNSHPLLTEHNSTGISRDPDSTEAETAMQDDTGVWSIYMLIDYSICIFLIFF